jgi:hypothetical protein
MRGLMVVVLTIGCGSGWIVRIVRIQRDAVAAIERTGGTVIYDWRVGNGTFGPRSSRWCAKWLVDLVGVDWFGHPVEIHLLPRSSNTGLVHLKHLSEVERLVLDGPFVTDTELTHLTRLSSLVELTLRCPHVTDAGLAHLKRLTNLAYLDLRSTRVTDAGLARLSGLTNVTTLYICNTKVTDAGLAHLKGLTRLLDLDLRGTQVTEAGFRELKKSLPGFWIYR